MFYAVENENYITVPFLLLFVVGYWYTGLMSLLQGRFSGVALTQKRTPSRSPLEYKIQGVKERCVGVLRSLRRCHDTLLSKGWITQCGSILFFWPLFH